MGRLSGLVSIWKNADPDISILIRIEGFSGACQVASRVAPKS
jgi:hypothetical protein